MAKFDGLSVSLERRRDQVSQDTTNASALSRLTYVVNVTGAGETMVEVKFPVAFVEEPATWDGCVYGGVAGINPSTEWTPTQMPTATALVLQWSRDIGRNQTYVGATLGLVTGGTDTDTFHIHVHFEAKALDRARS